MGNLARKLLISDVGGPPPSVDYLVVAGGGGGGDGSSTATGGGGGAGGYLAGTGKSITPGVAYTVTVGSGGSAGTGGAAGGDGNDSVFDDITSDGGGGGGYGLAISGRAGGSGGGGGADLTSGTGTKGTGTSGQGYDGSNGTGNAMSSLSYAGGGGGAGEAGGTDGNSFGGDGLAWSDGVTYGGGGGGGSNASAGTGGTGGGGTGAPLDSSILYVDDVSMVGEPQAVRNVYNSNSYKVYPNPANNKLYITGTTSKGNEIALLSATGSTVLCQKLTGTTEVDINTLPAGLYLYKINDDTGTTVQTGKLHVTR